MSTFRGVPACVRYALNMWFLGITLGGLAGAYMTGATGHDISLGMAKVIVRIVIPMAFASFVLFMFREEQR